MSIEGCKFLLNRRSKKTKKIVKKSTFCYRRKLYRSLLYLEEKNAHFPAIVDPLLFCEKTYMHGFMIHLQRQNLI